MTEISAHFHSGNNPKPSQGSQFDDKALNPGKASRFGIFQSLSLPKGKKLSARENYLPQTLS